MAKNIYDPSYFSALAQTIKKREKEMHPKQEEDQSKSAIHSFIGAREIERLIREFNPTKYPELYAAEWINEIELLGIIHKWDPYHLLLFASMRLTGVARTWYEYSLESICDWDDFKQELINNFPRSIDAAQVHSKLVAKKRNANETLEEYFHSTVKLAKRIKMEDNSIKEYLIRGLESSKHQVILSSIGPCSLTEFLQHMQRLEIDSTDPSPRGQTSSYHRDTSRDYSRSQEYRKLPERSQDRTRRSLKRSPSPERTFDIKRRSIKDEPRRHCYLCKSTEHFAANCDKSRQKQKNNPDAGKGISKPTKKPRLCFSCRKEGHNVKDCPESSQNKSEHNKPAQQYSRRDIRRMRNTDNADKNDDEFDLEIDLDADLEIDEDYGG